MKKKYYFPDPDPRFDIFGSENPVCIDKAECKRLAHEYGYTLAEFMRHMHEATREELITWGKYDTPCYDTPCYECFIWSNSSRGRSFPVTTRSAMTAAQEHGRCEGGEVIEIRTKSGRVLSRAEWTPENGGKYYKVTI